MLKKCMGRCGQQFPEASFTRKQWTKVALSKIKCQSCCKAMKHTDIVDKRQCTTCGQELLRLHFTDDEWRGGHGTHKCRECQSGPNADKNKGQWTCTAHGCDFRGDKHHFRYWREKQKVDKSNGRQKCNKCFLALDPDIQQLALHRRNLKHMQADNTKPGGGK